VRVSGTRIIFSNLQIGPGQPGSASISLLVTPPEVPEGLGVEEVLVETALAGGELTEIAELPTVRYVIPVERIREVDADGVPVAVGETVAVEGIATVASGVFNPSRFSTYLQDETGGVALDHPELYDFGDGAVVGRRYVALGRVSFYNGLTQIALEGS